MYRRTYIWTFERTYGDTYGRLDRHTDTNGWLDRHTNGWLDGHTYGHLDGHTDIQPILIVLQLIFGAFPCFAIESQITSHLIFLK